MNRKFATRVISLLPLRIEPRFVVAAFVSSLTACGGAPTDGVEVAPVDADVADAADALEDVRCDDGAAVIEEDDVDVAEDSDVDADEDVAEDSDVDADEDVAEDSDVDADEDVDDDVFTDTSVERSAAGSGHEQSRLNIATVNIGRGKRPDYYKRKEMAKAIDNVKSKLEEKSGPILIGWQEIGETDPCGRLCEIKEVRSTFDKDGSGFHTFRPFGYPPHGKKERVHVPVTLRGAGKDVRVRARFASAGWKEVSPPRFVTVAYSKKLNVAHLNTHFINRAWSRCLLPGVDRRREYWHHGWKALKKVVRDQVEQGHNVVVTGDLNRPRRENGCNEKWDPESELHRRAHIVGGSAVRSDSGIDYIFAVPAKHQRFVYKCENGKPRRGSIKLKIDGHMGWWVAGHFEPK